MRNDETLPVSVVALRAESYSRDGNGIVISLQTRFSHAERKYLVTVECFHDLIVDLQRLNTSTPSEPLQQDEIPIAANSNCGLTIKQSLSCPLYPRKRTCAVQLEMSALGQ